LWPPVKFGAALEKNNDRSIGNSNNEIWSDIDN